MGADRDDVKVFYLAKVERQYKKEGELSWNKEPSIA